MSEYFLRYFFSRFCREKINPIIQVKILRVFSVKKIGIVCVWVIRFLDKNPDNIGNFVIIFFYNWKSTLPTILSNICANISCFSDKILNKIYIFQKYIKINWFYKILFFMEEWEFNPSPHNCDTPLLLMIKPSISYNFANFDLLFDPGRGGGSIWEKPGVTVVIH